MRDCYRGFVWGAWRRTQLGFVAWSGLAWLFMGVANSDAKLYDDELQEILATYPDQVHGRSCICAHAHEAPAC